MTSYINRDILVSRDASALTGSVSVDLGYPAAGVLLPSNLVDTTDLETWSQELRIASDNDSRFQWAFGAFLFQGRPRLCAAVADPRLCCGHRRDARRRNVGGGCQWFPTSLLPYNADLPYDIKQFAIFGEVSYDLSDADRDRGRRYYDFKETRSFVSGGLFANGDNRTDSTKSSGFTPRFLLSNDLSDKVTVNAQASKGFRLGG